MSRARSARHAAALIALSLGLVALPVGCGGAGQAAVPGPYSPGAPAGDPTGTETARTALPVVRDAGDVNGIEVRTWTIDPLGGPIANALAPHEPARVGGDLDQRDERRWREHGFRLVEIPAELVATLERGMPHIDAVQRLWLGQPTTWAGVASRRLESDGGALGGRPVPVLTKLVVRSWVEPGVRRGPIRVELALSGTPLDGRDRSPLIMNELLLSHRLDPDTALVIVPAGPGEVWVVEGSGEDPATGESGANNSATEAGPEPAPRTRPPADGVLQPPSLGVGIDDDREEMGPVGPSPMPAGSLPAGTLGESLLVLRGRILSTPPRPAQQVLVIVPSAR